MVLLGEFLSEEEHETKEREDEKGADAERVAALSRPPCCRREADRMSLMIGMSSGGFFSRDLATIIK